MADDDEAGPRPTSPLEPAAWLTLGLLSATFAWWAAKEGAYFGVVLLPGILGLCAGAALVVRFAPWRAALRLSPPVIIAFSALVALGLWALLSAIWTPAPDVAITDAQRILVYALCFGLGVILCNLLGARMKLSLVPLACAGAFAGLLTAVSLAVGGEPRDLLEVDGTLDFPIGYRNAEAAFFALAMFPAIGLAADRDVDWRVRAGAVATATLCGDLFLLAQSRGSVPALAIAAGVLIWLSPQRVRMLSWAALAIIPVLVMVPAGLSLYSAADDGLADAVDEMNRAGLAILVTVAVAAVLGALAARHESRLPGLGSSSGRSNRRVAVVLLAGVAVAIVAFVAAIGNPVTWVGDRLDEFRYAQSPDLSEESSRFTFNAGSNRQEAWRVALDDAADNPVLGDGAGGFPYSYLEKRDGPEEQIQDAHSVELELLSELGVVGLGLFVIAFVAMGTGVIRARRLGPSAASLGAVALATGSYWLVHASIDWFWPYPALTAPTIALLGAACAPTVRSLEPRSTRRWRGWAIAALAVLAISTIPFWLSQRFINSAQSTGDVERAYQDLDRAHQLNPWSDFPLLQEGAIAGRAGDRDRAIESLQEAIEIRPEEWASHYLLARLQADSDQAAAREEIRAALERNPLEPPVRELAKELGVDPDTGALTGDEG